ncbi:hypothetical protein CKAH01_18955 [Colletotrichum kahawae]|uniref:Secreted protein n=1 Tax=Colletotrichum kahawae TaxID=34407 RepID=A0AAD9Y3W8_COLKA|nr:hypothetical protein CKAH01_18955 [Colletotrichum kahawae]
MRRTAWVRHLAAVAISALVKLPSVSITHFKSCCDRAGAGAIVGDGNRSTALLPTTGTGKLKEEPEGHVEFGQFG